jgi:hypothetical protein
VSASFLGGAIDVNGVVSVNLSSSVFKHNSAVMGGAAFINAVEKSVLNHNCLFQHANATVSVGGISLYIILPFQQQVLTV